MARHYSTRDFFRQMPNALLARYYHGRIAVVRRKISMIPELALKLHPVLQRSQFETHKSRFFLRKRPRMKVLLAMFWILVLTSGFS